MKFTKIKPGRKYKYLAAIIVVVFPILVGIWWLSIPLGFLMLVYKGIDLVLKKNSVLRGIGIFLFIFLFAIGLRIFAFEVYLVPSSSMEGTILPGDIVLVSKLKHGPNMPRSPYEIPWFNLFYQIAYGADQYPDSLLWKEKRLQGYGAYERGDIVVFEHPHWHSAFIKRCVGLPGDTIEIRSGTLFINNSPLEEADLVIRPYLIQVSQPEAFRELLREDGYWGRWISKNQLKVNLPYAVAEEYASYQMVDSIKPEAIDYKKGHEIFPGISWGHHSKWSIDHFGPYVLPWKGMKIDINAVTDNHYWRLINGNEGNERGLNVCDNRLCMADTLATSYEFKKNYYFFMGDNRHDSNDSRYWGPVQEDMLIGEASAILFSKGEDGIRWGRVFKPINLNFK